MSVGAAALSVPSLEAVERLAASGRSGELPVFQKRNFKLSER
jgi:hypothetical protein